MLRDLLRRIQIFPTKYSDKVMPQTVKQTLACQFAMVYEFLERNPLHALVHGLGGPERVSEVNLYLP